MSFVSMFCREVSYTLEDQYSARKKILNARASGPCQFLEMSDAEMAALRDATRRGEMWALSGQEESMGDVSPEYFKQMADRFRGRGETMTASWIDHVALYVIMLNKRIDEKCAKINDLQDLITSMARDKND